MNLKDKVAIVTGAGKGIGCAIAKALMDEGCRMMLVSRSKDDLSALQEYARSQNTKAVCLPLDLEAEGAVDRIITETMSCFGQIDVLINNAALSIKTNVMDIDEETWDRSMYVNAKVQFFLAQKALQQMALQQRGHIINIGSTILRRNEADHAVYGTSKIAMMGATQALTEEARKHYVKVTNLCPGVTDTPAHRKKSASLPHPVVPLQPEEVAQSAIFLLKQSHRVYVPELFLLNGPYPEQQAAE